MPGGGDKVNHRVTCSSKNDSLKNADVLARTKSVQIEFSIGYFIHIKSTSFSFFGVNRSVLSVERVDKPVVTFEVQQVFPLTPIRESWKKNPKVGK